MRGLNTAFQCVRPGLARSRSGRRDRSATWSRARIPHRGPASSDAQQGCRTWMLLPFLGMSVGVACRSVRSMQRDLLPDGPEEGRHLARDRCDHDGPRLPFDPEPTVAAAKAGLRLPGNIPDAVRQAIHPSLQVMTDRRREAIRSRRPRSAPASSAVAGLGDLAASDPFAGRVLRRHQAQISHQLARVVEPAHIDDFARQK